MSACIAIGTVFAKNYLAFARVLADSFQRRHPEVPFFAALVDDDGGYFAPAEEAFSVVELDELSIPMCGRRRFGTRGSPSPSLQSRTCFGICSTGIRRGAVPRCRHHGDR